ncbi:MAG: glycosyltransferase [Pseudomonadota bacterium]
MSAGTADAEAHRPSPATGRVAAVVIGRNEGARLVGCLESLSGRAAPVVYVDSGSTDDSVAAARALGASVVELDPARPFTAARGRNAGLSALADSGTEAGVEPPSVQFVDGDCLLEPGWIDTATAFLDAHPEYAVVCGRRKERSPEASLWNRLADMEWNTPPGDAAACGGDALMRRAAVEAAGGFREDLIAGEDPELSLRLARAGWRIHRLDAPMTLHDAAMTRFGQWRRRTRRAGWAAAEGFALHGGGPERYHRRTLLSIAVWGAGLPGLILAGTVAATVMGMPAIAALAIMLGLALFGLQAFRIARGRRLARNDSWPDAIAYGAFTLFGKGEELIGALSYLLARLRGRRGRIIEYKGPS